MDTTIAKIEYANASMPVTVRHQMADADMAYLILALKKRFPETEFRTCRPADGFVYTVEAIMNPRLSAQKLTLMSMWADGFLASRPLWER